MNFKDPKEEDKNLTQGLIIKNREKFQTEIRKKERFHIFQAKRFPSLNISSFENSHSNLTLNELHTLQMCETQKYSIDDFDRLYSLLLQPHKLSIYCGLIGFRKLTLDIENSELYSNFENDDFISYIIQMASNPKDQYMQYESLWIISNLALGEESLINKLAQKGSLLVLIQILNHDNEQIKMQGLWGIANIISEKQEFRDSLINAGIIDKLLNILKSCSKTCKEITIWTLSNIYKMKPWVEWELFMSIFDVLIQVMKEEQNECENLGNAMTLFYLYSKVYNHEIVENIKNNTLVECILELLKKHEIIGAEITSCALNTLRNLFSASKDAYNGEQFIICILPFFMNTQEVIRSSALELLNDMIEENPLLINYLVHSTDFLEKIEANFLNSFSKYERRGIFIFLEVLTRNSQWPDLIKIYEKNLLSFILNILKHEETYEILNAGLDCIRNFFEAENYNEKLDRSQDLGNKFFVKKFIEEQGDKFLEKLQFFKNELIYEKAMSLVEDFFDAH